MILPSTLTSMGTLISPFAFRKVNSYRPLSSRLDFSLEKQKKMSKMKIHFQ